jgi:hypothetical protein
VEGLLLTAGERLAIQCPRGWIAGRVVEAADGCLIPGPPDSPTVRVCVEPQRKPFDVTGWTRLARDAWCRDGHLVLRDVATSGFDLHAWHDGSAADLVLRWRPPARTRAAAMLLRKRARLLVQAVLLQYPALWAASARGRVPLHAAGVTAGDHGPVLLTGPSGVGKTSLVAGELAAHGAAISDNLVVGDGRQAWGVVEPMRSDQGRGRRQPHGRRAMHMSGRVPMLEPTALVVLARGTRDCVEECAPEAAARVLIASTYAAGELRRYWAVHALLALGTGVGPPHPPVPETAAAFAGRLRCLRVQLQSIGDERLAEHLTSEHLTSGHLAAEGAQAWT